MDLRHQFLAIRRFLPLIIGCVLLSTISAYLVSGILPKSYEAKVTLIVGQSLSAVNPDYSTLLASQRLSATYVELATTRPLLTTVIDELALGETPEQLARRVDAAAALDSTLLTISVTDTNPSTAAAVSNALAAALIKASPNLQGQEADVRAFVNNELRATQRQIESTQTDVETLAGSSERTAAEDAQLNLLESRLTSLRSSYVALLSFASNDASNMVTVVEPAVAPTDPVWPRPVLNAVLAGILGGLAVLAVLVVVTALDDSLKDAEEVRETLGLPTLGMVARMPTQRGRGPFYLTAMLLYPRSSAAESYRALRTNLEFAAVDAQVRTLLITSPVPGDGKTVTASNVAVAFAQAGRRVLLLDADLRKPGVHAMFGVPNDRGLSSLLRADAAGWGSVVRSTEQDGLSLLTTGPLPPNPAELLGTQRMRDVMEYLKEAYDLVVIDSPPLLVVTDAAILGSLVDGTLLVLDAKRTGRDDARRSRDALLNAGASILGVFLNGLPSGESVRYGGEGYYGSREADGEPFNDQGIGPAAHSGWPTFGEPPVATPSPEKTDQL